MEQPSSEFTPPPRAPEPHPEPVHVPKRHHGSFIGSFFIFLFFVALAAGGLYGFNYYRELRNEELRNEVNELRETIVELGTSYQKLERSLSRSEEENSELSLRLDEERLKIKSFERKIEDIDSTVGDLEKLSSTDEELLQKYSKVYFLNEHYVPIRLKEIDEEYVFDKERTYQIHASVNPFFEKMMEQALRDDIEMSVASAYRSYAEQNSLKAQYKVTFGEGANQFSADQGFSEHQLGTAIDLTTPDMNGGLDGFENTSAYVWMQQNAHKYGFTLSYPEDNQYYVFEPWHWRFVGVDLARDLKADELHFYDLDQREIDKYLLDIFE